MAPTLLNNSNCDDKIAIIKKSDESNTETEFKCCYVNGIEVTDPDKFVKTDASNIDSDTTLNCNNSNETTRKESSNNDSAKNINKLRTKIKNNCSLKVFLWLVVLIIFVEVTVLICLNFTKHDIKKSHVIKYINDSKIIDMHKNLSNFHPRLYWGCKKNCSYKQINEKSKIKFILPQSIWSNIVDWNFEYNIVNECSRYVKNTPIPFNDIYYNYVIGPNSEIYEARSLNCPFDETFLTNDHSNTIVIAIQQCFPESEIIKRTLKKFETIKELLNKLINIGVLNGNYIIELPDLCDKSLFANKLSELNRVSFYNYDNYNNSMSLNHKIIKALLFKEAFNNENKDQINKTIIHKQNSLIPPLPIDAICKNNYSDNFSSDDITIRFLFPYANWNRTKLFNININCSNDVKECWKNLMNEISETNELTTYNINYIIADDVIFEVVPLNCLSKTKDGKFIVKILLTLNLLWYYGDKTDQKIMYLSELISPIIRSLKTAVTYSKVNFQFPCDFVFRETFIIDLYRLLTPDVSDVNRDYNVDGYPESILDGIQRKLWVKGGYRLRSSEGLRGRPINPNGDLTLVKSETC